MKGYQETKSEALAALLAKVRACTACADALPLGPRPILQLSTSATILVASQAPGSKVHQSGVPFSDASGDRLREWMGLSGDEFYDERTVAIVPMGFCYPGRSGGGDAPPRADCTRLWRGELLDLLPEVRLTLLIGTYAQNHVLGPAALTPRVRNFRDYLPQFFPLPHPSWRSRIWEEKIHGFKRTSSRNFALQSSGPEPAGVETPGNLTGWPASNDCQPITRQETIMFNKLVLCGASALLMISSPTLAQEAAHPNDAQIAHIAYTAGELDVEAGRQALSKSHNKAVRSFAQTMVRDHGAVNEQALALVKKLHVTPQDNATSGALTKQAKEKARELGKLRGHAFDRAYIQNEVAFHRTVNGALSTTLIPSAHNAELKSLLETGLTLFQEHQKHAEQLAKNLR